MSKFNQKYVLMENPLPESIINTDPPPNYLTIAMAKKVKFVSTLKAKFSVNFYKLAIHSNLSLNVLYFK